VSETAGPSGPRFPSTKFIVPRLVSRLVVRPRLFDELDRGSRVRLTLVVGAPGAGKTTLLANWLAARPHRPAAWLSCDAADSDPVRFMVALIEALRHGFSAPSIGGSARELLDVDGEVSIDAVAALTDDLDGVDQLDGGIVVIDDFQLVGNESADVFAQLVDYAPSSLQVLIATRVDPPLRLHRRRAQEQLVELRDSDLAFSVDETKGFFSGFGLDLSEGDIETVQQRTEGWSAGLQMTAISMRTSTDQLTSVRRPEVLGQTVAGYFLEEVLYRQPQEVAEFMLATSVLDELSVPACNAVSGDRAASILESLLNDHLFTTVVDEHAHTFRYHQLIKEVLQAELHARDPVREARLHEAAARHLLSTGHAGAAARHLLAAGDPATAFNLLSDRVVRDVLTNPTIGSALDLDEFRPELFAGVPEVLVPLAAELLWRGSFEHGARAVFLARATQIDQSEQLDLAVRFALVNTLYCTFVGEFDEALTYRESAKSFEASATGVDDWIVTLDTLAMYCHAYVGPFDRARELAEMLIATGTTLPLTDVLCPGVMSQAAFIEGHLQEAAALAEAAQGAARRLGFDGHFFGFHALRTLGQLALERRDLQAAAELVETALGMVSGARPAFNFLAQLDRARIWAVGGHPDEALASLPAARSALKSQRSPLLAEADELEARLRLALGDPQGARNAAERLPSGRRLVTEVMLDLAQGNHAAAELALRDASAVGSTPRTDVEFQLLRANVALLQSPRDAPHLVRPALRAAQQQGYVQTVLDTAPQLLAHVSSNPGLYPHPDQRSALVAAYLDARTQGRMTVREATPVQLLTDAELRVLTKLAEHLTYSQTASELYVSVNTVKTHVRNAYMKLGVTSRGSAISRATALELL
jgi:LuxR family transcriptional regulator, maltose regulon positive regulatory protein